MPFVLVCIGCRDTTHTFAVHEAEVESTETAVAAPAAGDRDEIGTASVVDDCSEYDVLETGGLWARVMSDKFLELWHFSHKCELAKTKQGEQCAVWTYTGFVAPGRSVHCRKPGDLKGLEPGERKVPAWCWSENAMFGVREGVAVPCP